MPEHSNGPSGDPGGRDVTSCRLVFMSLYAGGALCVMLCPWSLLSTEVGTLQFLELLQIL